MRLAVLALALALTTPAAAQRVDREADALIVEWPGTAASANPRLEDHALALFEEDEWNRALVCPESRGAAPDPEHLRCEYRPVTALSVGGRELWLGVTIDAWEHDGMHGADEALVVIDAGSDPPRVIHTIEQWSLDVFDCFTRIVMRRHRVLDLDRDGEDELCVESVEEHGVGLFEVMDLAARGRRWVPSERSRGLSAWSFAGGRLVRRSTLDRRCPASGYELFVPPAHDTADPIAWRRRVQGARPGDAARGRRLGRTFCR